MSRVDPRWFNNTKADGAHEFCTIDILKRQIHEKKVQHVPRLTMHYDKPRATTDKQWTDQSLLSIGNLNTYLAESDAFQRTSFANIIEKWKERDRNQTNRLVSLFDTHYGMQIRFRRDNSLNDSSDRSYVAIAKYYRSLSNERTSKYDRPCERRTKEYEERHLHKLSTVKTPSQPYVLSKLTKLPSIKTTVHS